MTLIFFNLLANATFSLIGGLLVVGFFLWLFRVETGPWKMFLLSLPFLKIVYDFVRGVPSNSVLLAGIDPYILPPKHQTLMIGAGMSDWGPTFNTVFSVRTVDGTEYAASVGDYLSIWVNRTFGTNISLSIVLFVLGVAAFLILRRLTAAVRFERERTLDRQQSALTLPFEELGGSASLSSSPAMNLSQSQPSHHLPHWQIVTHLPFTSWSRTVDVYFSSRYSGTPFTGGIFKPYICFPSDSAKLLTQTEIDAVLQHELGHIAQFDLAVTIAIQVLGDLFWFVPGYRWLSRKIDATRELVADQWAVEKGVAPTCLASALVKLKDIPETSDRSVLYSAFFRKKSLLKSRVERLLSIQNEKPSRLGWRYRGVRIFASFWIFMAVMIATFGGNHVFAQPKNPEWFNQLLNLIGLA